MWGLRSGKYLYWMKNIIYYHKKTSLDFKKYMNENFHHKRTPFLILVNGKSKIIFFWLLTDDGEGFLL